MLAVALGTPAAAHDIPNQRIDRSIQVTIHPRRLRIAYEVGLSELTLTQDLRQLIGGLPGAGREEWLDQFGRITGPLNAKGFYVVVDRRHVTIEFRSFELVVEEHPRYTFHLEAILPEGGKLEIYDTNYATSDGTSRLAIRARDGASFTGDSMPTEVSEIPIRPVWDLSDEEELRSKRVVVNFSSAPKADARAVPGDVKPASPVGEESTGADTKRPQPGARTSPIGIRLNDLLDRRRGASTLGLLLIAAVLGAAHSLQPGHGKSLVSTVAMGRGTLWYHPIVLAIVTSAVHTGSVMLVAAALAISGTSRVEEWHHALARTAGFLIAAAGFWRMGRFLGGHGEHSDESPEHTLGTPGTLELVGIGFSGGIVPCWDAVGLLVLASALGRLALGVVSVAAFGVGMAVVLVAVGLVAHRFRSTLLADSRTSRLESWLGIATGVILAMVGLALFLQ